MKILIINYFFNKKSVGFIVRDCAEEYLKKSNEVFLALGDVNGQLPPNSMIYTQPRERLFYTILNRLGRLKFKASNKATQRVIRFINMVSPDIVHIHLAHCYSLNIYSLLRYLAESNIKTVLTHHSEFYYTGSCAYSYSCLKFVSAKCKACPDLRRATGARLFGSAHMHWVELKKAFDMFDPSNLFFTAVSPWVATRSLLSPLVNRFSCTTIKNGINTSVYNRKNIKPDNFRFNIDIPYLLHISASFDPLDKDDIKGGYYIVKLAERMPDNMFYVVSSDKKNIDQLPPNVVYLGKTDFQYELSVLYCNALLTLLTSKNETFSMVCAESLCCGTPVVGFKAGGPESIAIDEYSDFVKYGDIDALVLSVRQMILADHNKDEISSRSLVQYSKERMANEYLDLYNRIINVS